MADTTGKEPRPITIEVQQFKFAVRPHPFRVAPRFGEEARFKIENDMPLDIEVDFLRDDLVTDAQGKPIRTLPVAHGATSDLLTVNMNLPNGRYPYQVAVQMAVSLRSAFEATGGSRPEIEIRK